MTPNREVQGHGFQSRGRLEKLNRDVVVAKLDALSIEPRAVDLHASLESCRDGLGRWGHVEGVGGALPCLVEMKAFRGGGNPPAVRGFQLHGPRDVRARRSKINGHRALAA